MGRTDWDRIFSADPSSLTDDDMEALYPAIISCDVDEISDTHNLRTLMKLSQEILQYKDNQVESLLLECGELKQTISSLKPEPAKRRKKEGDDSRRESTDLSKHVEMSESTEYDDALQGKNKKIKILVTELESLENDNLILKERLTTLTREMEDATVKMNEMAEELSSARVKSVEYKESISELERENSALVAQVEEITAQQIDRDRAIDEFGSAIDSRINEWKAILDEKDNEILRLKENLSQSVLHSVTSVKEQSKSEIIRLNEEIDCRDKIINELKTKLSEATVEINESASLIEKLKADAKKVGKVDKKKEHKDLLKKLQDASEQISKLQTQLNDAEEDAQARSSKLCEVLATLKKYEDENESLAEALHEIKQLKDDLKSKTEHIRELIDVVNKLEMLNSYQEMEIITLREKLGIPEDESVSIERALAKRKEQEKKLQELLQQNKVLVEENIELKSDMRVLKYKLSKTSKELDISDSSIDGASDFFHSTKLTESVFKWHSKVNISEVQENMQLIIDENEALRRGMHEILDSIRSQDGKSVVEIQSSTLERLLEALDVRHLAGWYHPVMRLQEHLNVVQGSNAELRGQLKQLRKELQKKDKILHALALNKHGDLDKVYTEESDSEKLSMYLSEMKNLQEAYKNEADEWEKQKNSLIERNDELSNEIEKLKLRLEVYEQSARILEEGEDEIRKAFVAKTKEFVEASGEALIANRKNVALQKLLAKETARAYHDQKEAIKNESYLRKALADSSKHSNVLEREVSILQSNLFNSVSSSIYNELKEKHEELSIRFRGLLENNLISGNENEIESLKKELELARRVKDQLVEHLQKETRFEDDGDVMGRLKDAQARELLEKQRADHVTSLHEILQVQLSKCEESLKEITAAKSELQEELIILHKRLSKDVHFEKSPQLRDNKSEQLNDKNAMLQTEVENLKKQLEITQEEAQRHYSLNSLKTLELDDLRHQILNLQAVSEDKATISRLDFELASKNLSEMELNAQKLRLENEVSCLQEELDKSRTACEGLRTYVQDCRRQCENRCRMYVDIIRFFQNLYSGSTSISALDRIVSLSVKLKNERQNIDSEMKKAKEYYESTKQQQELLNNRLQIVESLKDILEQQIGSSSVEDIVQRFSEYSQYTLNDFKYKRKITQLEYELQIANNKFMEYESAINEMEHDMIQIQKAWSKGDHQQRRIDTRSAATSPPLLENKHAPVQATIEVKSKEVQTDPYTCCLEKKETSEVEVQTISPREPEDLNKKTKQKDMAVKEEDTVYSKKEVENIGKAERDVDEKSAREVSLLRDQLNEAMKLASERSSTLIKYEMQMAENQARVDSLNRTIKSKDSELTEKEKLLEEYKLSSQGTDCADKLALKSSINSLQKLLNQKEETIARYQNLLKEDRDEHSKAAARLQEEIRSLHARVQSMQRETQRTEQKRDNKKEDRLIVKLQETSSRVEDVRNSAMQVEEVARLEEKVSTLEADLNITKELSDRWHRLAEERLNHMDRMRERLEEQHKSELESYRGECAKWQTEAEMLRTQLSENRMLVTKGNMSLMKELQEKDDKIHQLTLAYQQLQNEVELIQSTNRSRNAITQGETEITSRDHTQRVDSVRKQLQSLLEKEKMYKNEITELKQQISRRYTAVKSQEKRASQRETQLERKVKSLEEELEKARAQLDREYLAHEAKRLKTAEELALWEKQKKWQQMAERFKEKLKEKTDEYTKLQASHEKLRSVVSCMEREKWYLKSKLKLENTMAGSLSARPVQQNVMEELQKECQILRERIKELSDRLENEDNEKLLLKVEEQKRRIAALEIVSQGNSYVVSQLEKLEMTKDILEKMNLALEAENFELRLELEKANGDAPRLREKVEHLEKYIKILKEEKSSDCSPMSSDKESRENGSKKTTMEMEKTIFTLKRIIEKLQVENKRLKLDSKKSFARQGVLSGRENDSALQRQYEDAQKRIVALETDLQLAEQRVTALEKVQKEDDNAEIKVLREQLSHKSELLDKVKHLLSRAAINEKSLRQRVQQLESKQTLSTIPECHVTPPSLE
ncbi:centrosomal protein of 290 kDa [Ceratina calcarata]|uniref:Centrosomal protein of 290 kDa n=1 Tax=Ceratina calcarata TaxID=156304 RepID=A0AAJ7RWF5_9HYME|nr:centrosomal protein of 290 kDa [Ceratina calcarata]XP_026666547.1 centrosomal protein of 290 kDa [Ceratina calcarata]XP_026666548.1 centrosomal protein of 290 kDa [Ceratina calcarata]XP_026666549.1 centrosomal protein of 290 kDa [Ceratina calcarata]